MKVRCELKLPNICESALITREIEINDSELKKSEDEDLFIRLQFARAIEDELIIEYEKIGD